ncbi:MAG: FmdB family zinc ribbon protein [Acidimicrobiales bacterium]
MPIYEYKCTVCEQHIDVEQSFTDDALTVLDGCAIDPSGQHRLKKVFSAVGISFKGDGFYRNDARAGASKSAASTSSTSTDDAGDSSSKSTSNGSSGDSSTSDTPSTTSTTSPASKKADTATSNGSTSDSKSSPSSS